MRAERPLALEAAILLVVTHVVLRVSSFKAAARLLTRLSRASASRAPDSDPVVSGARVGAAVRAAARRLPNTTCLMEALAAEAMLRRRGVVSTLHIGVRPPSQAATLDAHAWLECHGHVVVGDHVDLGDYRVLARPS
jgi:hypothetical protein